MSEIKFPVPGEKARVRFNRKSFCCFKINNASKCKIGATRERERSSLRQKELQTSNPDSFIVLML